MPRFARYLSRAVIETFVRRYLTSVFLSVPGKVYWTTLRCQPFFFSFGEKKIRESDRKFSRNNFVVLTEEQQADRRDLFPLFFLPSFLFLFPSFILFFFLGWLIGRLRADSVRYAPRLFRGKESGQREVSRT